MINKAIQLKQELDKLRPISPEMEQRIMQKFRLDWNYHSNNLEGNSLTYGETKALILFGITANGKPLREHDEIIGHDEAIKWILEIIKEDRPLSEMFIRELHQLILKEPYKSKAKTHDGKPTTKTINIGVYKTSPNHVETVTGEMFYFATPEETPAKMADLVKWYRDESEKNDVNPILLAAEFHYKFIRIHPFDDGNGRTARILMNFILLRFNYPPVIIKTEDKENYFAALRQADANIFEPFVNYIASNLVHSLEIMLKGAKGESIDEPDDIDKEIALLKASLSEDEKGKEKKSRENVSKVITEVFKPLIKKLVKKCKSLDDLFYESSSFFQLSEFFIDNNGGEHFYTESVDRIENLDLTLYTDVAFIYHWDKLKKNDTEFGEDIKIQVGFYPYSYSIISEFNKEKETVTGYYGVSISNSKIDEIVSKLIKNVIKEIKEAVETNQ